MKRNWKEIISIAASAGLSLAVFLGLLAGLGWNLLLCMGLAAASYPGFLLVLRPVKKIGRMEVEKIGNGEVLHERLLEAGTDYRRMQKAAGKILDPVLKQDAQTLLATAGSILKFLTDNPKKIPSARRYIDYYQETAANVLENYVELQDSRLATKEAQRILQNTKEAVATLKEAFQMQFEKLLQNELMDMEADLNLLKQIFGGNVTFNTNEDFRSQFNDDWAGQLLICVDEVLLNRREDSERIKNLSTARSYKAEAKGRDRREVEFFGKFVLCSNNERNPVLIEAAETRYWVRRIPPLTHDDQQLLARMQTEIPGLLFFLQQRTLSTREESRLWFSPRLLTTEALRRIIHYNRSKPEAEMLSIIRDILDGEKLEEYQFDVSDMVNMLEIRGIRVDHPTVRRTLTESWQLRPAPPTYYQRYTITYNGLTQRQESKTARIYTVTREQLGGLLNDAAM